MKSRKNLDDDAIQAASKQALSCWNNEDDAANYYSTILLRLYQTYNTSNFDVIFAYFYYETMGKNMYVSSNIQDD
jgi:hypothetical protein